MLRLRLASLAAAAGLMLVCGCSTPTACSNGSFMSRLCGRSHSRDCATPVEVVAVPEGCCDGGPLLGDPGPGFVLPGGVPGGVPGSVPTMPMVPDGALPLSPPPRLVPQPQSQPFPYTP